LRVVHAVIISLSRAMCSSRFKPVTELALTQAGSPHVKHDLSVASPAMAKAQMRISSTYSLSAANFVQRAAVVNLRASLRKTRSLRDQSVAPPDTRTHSPVT
jgi:hypothetical protein